MVGFYSAVDIVPGFKGTSSLRAAILRGEVDGFCAMRYRDIGPVFAEGMMQPIMQANIHHDITKGVPHFPEVVEDQEDLEALDVLISTERFRFSFAVPSETPGEKVTHLRVAFQKMVNDREFLEEAASLKLIPIPEEGQDLQSLAEEMRSLPDALRQRINEMIN